MAHHNSYLYRRKLHFPFYFNISKSFAFLALCNELTNTKIDACIWGWTCSYGIWKIHVVVNLEISTSDALCTLMHRHYNRLQSLSAQLPQFRQAWTAQDAVCTTYVLVSMRCQWLTLVVDRLYGGRACWSELLKPDVFSFCDASILQWTGSIYVLKLVYGRAPSVVLLHCFSLEVSEKVVLKGHSSASPRPLTFSEEKLWWSPW